MKKINLAIVGATGLVGQCAIKRLEEENLNINKIKFLASYKNEGKRINFKNEEFLVETLTEDSFFNMDYAIFLTPSEVSKKYIPYALKEKVVVIDNSSFFRENKDVPLIIPSINFNRINDSLLISNPNCSTIQCLKTLFPLHLKYKLKKVIYSTYQSVSGAGKKGLDGLRKRNYFHYDISKTCIPFIGEERENNYTQEEIKMINETKKILNLPKLKVDATCVRVPVEYCHGVSIWCEFSKEIDIDEVNNLIRDDKELILLDDLDYQIVPNGISAYNTDLVYVGRIRKSKISKKSLSLYCVADNLRVGAASNAIDILKNIIIDK